MRYIRKIKIQDIAKNCQNYRPRKFLRGMLTFLVYWAVTMVLYRAALDFMVAL